MENTKHAAENLFMFGNFYKSSCSSSCFSSTVTRNKTDRTLLQLSHARAPWADSKNFTSVYSERTLQWEDSTQTLTVSGKGLGSMVHGPLCVLLCVFSCILVCTHTDKSLTLPIAPSPSSCTVRVLVKEAHSSPQPANHIKVAWAGQKAQGTQRTVKAITPDTLSLCMLLLALRKNINDFSEKLSDKSVSKKNKMSQFKETISSLTSQSFTHNTVHVMTNRSRASTRFSSNEQNMSIKQRLQSGSSRFVQPICGESLSLPSSHFSFSCNLSSPLCLTTCPGQYWTQSTSQSVPIGISVRRHIICTVFWH